MATVQLQSPTSRHVHGERSPLRPVQRVAAVAAYFGLVYRRTWMGSVFSRFVMPLLFLLAMGIGLGSLVDDASGGVDGVPYLLFVAPAMIAVQAMMTAVSESTYPVYGLFTWNRMYHSMLATPLTVSDLLLGHLAVIAAQGGFAAAAFVLVAALLLAGMFMATRTAFGRRIYAIGGNLEAARLSGISVERTKLAVFAINGLMVAIAGLILSSRLGAGSPSAGNIAELDAIAACVIGGTSLAGGVGSVAGAVMGAFIMSALDNGMSMMDVATFWQYIVKGVILLLAVWMDSATKRRS